MQRHRPTSGGDAGTADSSLGGPNLQQQKTLYDRASRLISEALDREQPGIICVPGDRKRVSDLYQSGLALLDRALALRFDAREL